MRQLWFPIMVLVMGLIVDLVHMDNGNYLQDTQRGRYERFRGYTNTPQINRGISIVGDEFIVDGKPLQILSGSLHYYRVPAEYWRDRLQKLRACGLNAVSTYVEWSFHEPEERQYNFEGDRDLAAFVNMAAEEGLFVLLRPGPYICAERDLGGFPYWLLTKNIRLRSTDTRFIHETKVWLRKLFHYMTPLLYENGGPIILVQVENEYGSYGSDKVYMGLIRDTLLEHVGNKALLYTTDGPTPSYYLNGNIPGAVTTIDFGAVDFLNLFGPDGVNVSRIFSDFRKYVPEGPLMNSEFYPGWLTHWGEELQQVATADVIRVLRDMLDLNINVNIYVFFGGTNFEFSAGCDLRLVYKEKIANGANYGGTYLPDITSYDYDAPLTEAGDPTDKYYAIRRLIEQYIPSSTNVTLPVTSPKGAYGPVSLAPKISLLSAEGRKQLGRKHGVFHGERLPSFENLPQRAGVVMYETVLEGGNGVLVINGPRDIVYVYVDDKYQGKISRTEKNYALSISSEPNSKLSLLVESQGRINFGPFIHDYKGINSTVIYKKEVLNGPWEITGFPLEELRYDDECTSRNDELVGPMIFDGFFTLPDSGKPLDTFLNPSGWGKGYVWINGHNLGRYWPRKGPQLTLYVPGVWLLPAPAMNHIEILELESISPNLNMKFIDFPILNQSQRVFY